MIVESNAFTEDFRTSPVEAGDTVFSQNWGKGLVIATYKDKAWIVYEDGRDRISKISVLVKSGIVKVVH